MAGLTATQRRDVQIMTAQGETPDRIAEHLRVPVDAVKRVNAPRAK